MKSESLHALLIDRELGELAPEAVELLDAWLAEHPESAAAVPALRRTLETARAAVHRFPELARPELPLSAPNVVAFSAPRFRLVSLAIAASIVVLLGGTAWLGFRVGLESERNAVALDHRDPTGAAPANTLKPDGPWARYALAPNPHGGLTVVRRDPKL